MLARGFDKPAVTAVYPTSGRNTAISPGRLVSPHDHLAAVALAKGICLDVRLWPKIGVLGIRHIGVFALVVTAHQHRTAAGGARCVDAGLVAYPNVGAQHLDAAALPLCAGRVEHTCIERGAAHQLNFSAF